MNDPTKYVETRLIPFDDSDSISHFTEHVCRAMLNDASRKILDCISSCGEYSFRLHEITAVNEPMSQSTEFRLVMEILKITRCKNCKYWNRLTIVTSKDERKGLCEHHDHIMATREDFFCADGEEKDDETTADRHEHV